MQNAVKRLFAQELESMLEEMPFDKIRITELSRRCGVTPQTFYYHFYDKYDLSAWIFLKDLSDAGDVSRRENLALLLSRMWGRRTFYSLLLNQQSQNSLTDYLMDFYALHANSSKGIDQYMIAWYDMYGSIGLATRWLKGELSVTAEELGDFLARVTSPFLYATIARNSSDLLATASKSRRQSVSKSCPGHLPSTSKGS